MNAVRVAGPNTVGEAGKVYFAHRFQTGQSLFATADQPPYYPSFHGPLFHSVVGAIGRVCGATVLDLYGIGRTISVLATCGSFLLAGLTLTTTWDRLEMADCTHRGRDGNGGDISTYDFIQTRQLDSVFDCPDMFSHDDMS